MKGQGDFFDPVMKAEQALDDHARDDHAGKTDQACAQCRELSKALHDVAQRYEGTYRFSGTGDCRFCGLPVLWFTTPTGSQMPIDRERLLEAQPALTRRNAFRGFWTTRRRGADRLLPFNHWATCPNVQEARTKGVYWYEEDPGPRPDGPGDVFAEAW